MSDFTHWNEDGRPRMVDISDKNNTLRTAIAQTTVSMSTHLFEAIQNRLIKKGDPIQVAQVAGIMATKKTSDLLPMCHPILLQGTDFTFEYKPSKTGYDLIIKAQVKCNGNTGVEMEALTGVTVAALTFYDMCKSVDKRMVIKETFLLNKTGGKNGDFSYNPIIQCEKH